MKYAFVLFMLCLTHWSFAQKENPMPTDTSTPLPYAEIPEAPAEFNACTVVARMVDGLGFRYYWATEGLRPEDLAYQIGADARTSEETLFHIYGLADVIYNSVHQQASIRPIPKIEMSFEELRAKTLGLLKATSDTLRTADPDALENYQIIFERKGQQSSYPFWNQLNGPLADALWHVGQVVAFRRASGNPLNFRVSVFQGNLRNE